jgi:hypothetical protein
VHRCHVYVGVGVGVPVNVTAEVKVLPLVNVPVGAVDADTCGATGVELTVVEDTAEMFPALSLTTR